MFLLSLNNMTTLRIHSQEIIVTHWHHDHVGGVHDIHNQLQKLDKIPVSKLRRPESPDVPLVDDDGSVEYNFVDDGAIFSTEGATLKALFTPGHTTDHICLTLDEEKSLFAGDTILGEGSSIFEDLFDYMNSLQLILRAAPRVVYPGHGPVISDPIPAIQAYIDHRNKRERQILTALKNDVIMNIEEIVGVVYPGLAENLLAAAGNNVQHHLTKLEKEQKVLSGDGGFKLN